MLKKCLGRYKWLSLVSVISGILQVIAAGLAIVFFQKLLDSFGGVLDYEKSLRLLAVFGLLQVVDYVISYLANYTHSQLENGFTYFFKTEAVKKVSTINYLSYKKYGTGELIQIIENGAGAGREILYSFYINILRNLLPSVIVSIVIIGFYDLTVLLAIGVSYLVVFIITKLLLKKLYMVKNNSLIKEEKFMQSTVRSLTELVVFRLGGMFVKEIKKCSDTAKSIVSDRTKILMTHELFFTVFALIVVMIKAAAIYIGVKGLLTGTGSVGAIYAVVALIDKIYQPIAIFNVEYVDFKLNKAAFARYQAFMDEVDDYDMLKTGDEAVFQKNICIKDVSYRRSNKLILDHINIELNKGEKYALVGESGSGKTTVLNLLARLIKTESGKILLDGADIRKTDIKSYYSKLGYLTQTPPVFEGSIRENLDSDNTFSDERLYKVLKDVNLYAKIMEMENGLNEIIGEKGGTLSGGEKQRLAAARILLLKPEIVLMDEPTNALDAENEKIVLSALMNNLRNSMIIAVIHQKGTISGFDHILRFKEGVVVME